MIKQKVTVTLEAEENSDELTIKFSFTPGLAGSESADWKNKTTAQKNIQNQAAIIGKYVMEALKKDSR